MNKPMNPDEVSALAREIYIRMASVNPDYWDKQRRARQSIEWALHYFLALQYEKEGISYSSEVSPHLSPNLVK